MVPYIKTILGTLLSLFIAVTPALASQLCNYEDIPITLKAIDTPVEEILHDIGEQSQYSIDVKHPELLQGNRSISFRKTGLKNSFKRLFKGINYSIICNEEEKSLSLVLFDSSSQSKSSPHRAAETQRPSRGNQKEITGAESAFEDRNEGIVAATSSDDEGSEEMGGIEQAMASKTSTPDNQKKALEDESEPTEMDPVTQAFESYKSGDAPTGGDVQTGGAASNTQTSSGEMAGVEQAMDDYNAGVKTEINQPSDNQETPTAVMDEVDGAFDDYSNRNSK